MGEILPAVWTGSIGRDRPAGRTDLSEMRRNRLAAFFKLSFVWTCSGGLWDLSFRLLTNNMPDMDILKKNWT
jgi:hypothetical protein